MPGSEAEFRNQETRIAERCVFHDDLQLLRTFVEITGSPIMWMLNYIKHSLNHARPYLIALDRRSRLETNAQ